MASRNWCFTLNNPGYAVHLSVPPHCTSLCYQIEEGAAGTPHLQGYVAFAKSKRSLKQLKEWLPTAHFEVCKGTPGDNWRYCTKPDGRIGGPYTYGDQPKGAGARTDLADAAELSRKRKWLDIDPVTFVKYHRGLRAFAALHLPHRNERPTVYWLWGPAGCGKSKMAAELADIHDSTIYFKPAGQWWDGYDQQNIIVLDDLRSEDYPYSQLLRILDRYPLQAPVKGGFVPLNSRTIVITTPQKPELTYTNDLDCITQLLRRVTVTMELTGKASNPSWNHAGSYL